MGHAFYAIGGGNVLDNETLLIDLDIIKECGKNNPTLLLIAAASNFDKIEPHIH